jgi:hypothetical protein
MMSSTVGTPAVVQAGMVDEKEPKRGPGRPPKKGPALRRTLDLSKNEFRKVNWYYPGGREAFPTNPRLWTVDACFPYAEGGMLLADIVMLEHKFLEAREKAAFFKKNKINYVAMLQNGTILDLDDPEVTEKNFRTYGET